MLSLTGSGIVEAGRELLSYLGSHETETADLGWVFKRRGSSILRAALLAPRFGDRCPGHLVIGPRYKTSVRIKGQNKPWVSPLERAKGENLTSAAAKGSWGFIPGRAERPCGALLSPGFWAGLLPAWLDGLGGDLLQPYSCRFLNLQDAVLGRNSWDLRRQRQLSLSSSDSVDGKHPPGDGKAWGDPLGPPRPVHKGQENLPPTRKVNGWAPVLDYQVR